MSTDINALVTNNVVENSAFYVSIT
jgi:hypothetical protein